MHTTVHAVSTTVDTLVAAAATEDSTRHFSPFTSVPTEFHIPAVSIATAVIT